ncbi:hypothetical protein Q8A73_006136 [Channa argus]|nr:hypothetical protein Q8A73_006136 [Channa argus]
MEQRTQLQNWRDAGVYWCGVKPNQGNYRAALQRIQLEVQNISVIKRSSAVGQTLTYWCSYPEDAPVNKFICKGEDPYVCEQLVNILKPNMKTGKLSIEDDREERNITVTVRNLIAEDTGTYWCGAGTSDEKRRNQLFNKLLLTQVKLPSTAETSILENVAGSQLAAVTATVVRVAALVVAQKSEEIEEKNRKVGIVAMQRYRTHPEDRLRNCNENSCDGTQERL